MIKSNYQRMPFIMANIKRNIFQRLLQEYDIESTEDIQDALKGLLSGTIQATLESEMNEHLGYDKYEHSEESNYRNGTNPKSVRSKYGEFEADVPQDRQTIRLRQIQHSLLTECSTGIIVIRTENLHGRPSF